jgi:hypothetical protein
VLTNLLAAVFLLLTLPVWSAPTDDGKRQTSNPSNLVLVINRFILNHYRVRLVENPHPFTDFSLFHSYQGCRKYPSSNRLYPLSVEKVCNSTVTHTQCYQLGNQGIDMGVFGIPVGKREFFYGV